MTPYTRSDLDDEWELKIMRSGTGAFSDPSKLQQMLTEEAAYGWVLVEKFDSERVRLKRRCSASTDDAMKQLRGGDPYRTTYGMSEWAVAGLTLVAILAVLAIVVASTFLAKL